MVKNTLKYYKALLDNVISLLRYKRKFIQWDFGD